MSYCSGKYSVEEAGGNQSIVGQNMWPFPLCYGPLRHPHEQCCRGLDEEVMNTPGGFVAYISFLAFLAGVYLRLSMWGVAHEASHLYEHHTLRTF